MRVRDHKKFAMFDYKSTECKNPYKVGDVVIKPLYYDGKKCNEIGVVLQVHDDTEVRTDMFGNECISILRVPTLGEVKKYRPKIMEDIMLREEVCNAV